MAVLIRDYFCIEERFSKVPEEENSTRFEFGDGYAANSLKFVTFSGRIDKRDINIRNI